MRISDWSSDVCSSDLLPRCRHDAAMARTAATHTLVLPIAPERWRPPAAAIELDGLRLEPKPELHITLVGRVLGAGLHAEFGDRAEDFIDAARRSAERRVGKESVSTCRSRWWQEQ